MLLTILLLASLGSAAFPEENVLDIDIIYFVASDEATADGLDAPFAEEYRMLQEKVFEALKSAKYYTPVDPEGELVGQTVCF